MINYSDFMGNKISPGDYLAYQLKGWTGLLVCRVLDLCEKQGNESLRVIFTGRKRTSMITEHNRRAVLVREIDVDIHIWKELNAFARSRN